MIKDAINLKVIGILRAKEEMEIPVIPTGFAYSDELVDFILEDSKNSDIAVKQKIRF